MDIKVGEYIRTKDGEILKIDSFEKDCKNINCVCFTTGEIYTQELLNEIIVKHSKNIIDLIEVGDIVNKSEVYEIGQSEDGQKWIHTYQGILYYEEDLQKATILTHELYNANCYKVKGE